MMANSRMSGAANDLVSSLHAARAEASARGRNVVLCASSDWDAERPSCDAGASLLAGWVVFEDADVDGAPGDAEPVLQVHGPLDAAILGQAGSRADAGPPQFLSFRPGGPLQEIGGNPSVRNIQLCDARGDHDTGGGRAAGRWIAISPAGRPALIDRVERLQGDANPLGGC
jgi:type IV fimbrial biogenesis protein FimT